MSPGRARGRAGLVPAGAAVVVYLVLVGSQLGRPLMYDDANFALAARAVAETGRPFGNQGWMSERGDFSQREQWGLWHPPLYVYSEGLATRLGGWTPPALRSLGVVAGVATAALTYRLAFDLTHGPEALRHLAGGIAVALALLSPLMIQSTLILDIDFPLLVPLTLLFLILYRRLEGRPRAWLWLAPLFALMLWSKMTNPVPLVGVAVVWQLLRGRHTIGRAMLHLVGIGLGGVALFGISWLLIGRWLSFPLDMPFGVNLVQWQDSAEVARRAYVSPGAFIEGLQPSVLWLGPGLVTVGLVGLAIRVGQLARCRRFAYPDLLIGVVAVLVLGYVNKSAGWFPKYQVALAPLLACLAASVLARLWWARPQLASTVSLLTALSALAIVLRLVRDDWALQRTWVIDPSAGAWLLGVVLVSTAVGFMWGAPAAAIAGALVGVTLGWSLATDAYQLNAAYSTDYWYGTLGTVEAADWVDAHLTPDQTYLAAKEVAIRSRDQRYVDQDNLVYFLGSGRDFGGTWAGEPLHALVTWQREPYIADLVSRWAVGAGFRESARFGDYVIYEPASGS